jgi:hypothetical protein
MLTTDLLKWTSVLTEKTDGGIFLNSSMGIFANSKTEKSVKRKKLDVPEDKLFP